MNKKNSDLQMRIGILKGLSFSLLIILLLFQNGKAQGISANAGIGLQYFSTPSLSKYLSYAAPGSITPGTYQSAIQFVVGGQYLIGNEWAVGLEYGYITRTISGGNALGAQQIDFSYSLPTVTLRKIILGDGYYMEFGGGVGYHFAGLSTSSPYSSQALEYSSQGLGLKMDASLDTKLGEKLYARVDAEARAEFTGTLKTKSGVELTYVDYNTSDNRPVNMYLSGVGITFGLVYYF